MKSGGFVRSYRMRPRYVINLKEEERAVLTGLTHTGKTNARKFVYARALLMCDVGAYCGGQRLKVVQVAEALGITERTVERIKRRFLQEGMEASLKPRPRTVARASKFDGAFEAQLIALACSPPPEGRVRWTMRLLAQKVVELKITPSVCVMTVHGTLKKTNCVLT
jgi:hypothetical protein